MRDKIKNEVICDIGGGTLIEDKMREATHRWFKHVMRRVSHVPRGGVKGSV